jgi:hypothetical protein
MRIAHCRSPAAGLADLHIILAQAVMGDGTALNVRASQMQDLAREGRYPSGSYLPALSRGFAAFERGDFPAAIDALAPLAGESERIGGSRAQHDLIEFTLLRAYLDANRPEDARRLLGVCSARGGRAPQALPSQDLRRCTDPQSNDICANFPLRLHRRPPDGDHAPTDADSGGVPS